MNAAAQLFQHVLMLAYTVYTNSHYTLLLSPQYNTVTNRFGWILVAQALVGSQ
jgi:hypothetical protein